MLNKGTNDIRIETQLNMSSGRRTSCKKGKARLGCLIALYIIKKQN